MNASAGASPLLEARGVTRRFGGLTAVREVDLTLSQGEVLGLIGPNGAGKTTLFNLLSGQLHPDRGVIRLLGQEIQNRPPHRVCRLGLARTFQVPRPFLGMTVFESVLVGAAFGRPSPGIEAKAAARECLERTRLDTRRDAPVHSLNLAERKRLDLARAIAGRPRVLLVDEVAAGLNPSEVRETVAFLREVHRSGIGIIYVEHVMEAVMDLSDRVQVLEQGATIAIGTPEEVTRSPAVIEAYLGSAAASAGGTPAP